MIIFFVVSFPVLLPRRYSSSV